MQQSSSPWALRGGAAAACALVVLLAVANYGPAGDELDEFESLLSYEDATAQLWSKSSQPVAPRILQTEDDSSYYGYVTTLEEVVQVVVEAVAAEATTAELEFAVGTEGGTTVATAALNTNVPVAVLQAMVDPDQPPTVIDVSNILEEVNGVSRFQLLIDALLAVASNPVIDFDAILAAAGLSEADRRRALLQVGAGLAVSVPSPAFAAGFAAQVASTLSLGATDVVNVAAIVTLPNAAIIIYTVTLNSRCYLCDLRNQASSESASNVFVSDQSSSEENFPASQVTTCSVTGSFSFQGTSFPFRQTQSLFSNNRPACANVDLPHSSSIEKNPNSEFVIPAGSSKVEASKNKDGGVIDVGDDEKVLKSRHIEADKLFKTKIGKTTIIIPVVDAHRK